MNRQETQSGGVGGNLEDQFDPFGFLNRGSTLTTIADRPVNAN